MFDPCRNQPSDFLCKAIINRNSHRRCSREKGVLKNFANVTRKYLCLPVKFAKLFRTPFLQNTPGTPVFACEICEIIQNTIFTEHLRWLLLCKWFLYEKNVGLYILNFCRIPFNSFLKYQNKRKISQLFVKFHSYNL